MRERQCNPAAAGIARTRAEATAGYCQDRNHTSPRRLLSSLRLSRFWRARRQSGHRAAPCACASRPASLRSSLCASCHNALICPRLCDHYRFFAHLFTPPGSVLPCTSNSFFTGCPSASRGPLGGPRTLRRTSLRTEAAEGGRARAEGGPPGPKRPLEGRGRPPPPPCPPPLRL